MFVAIISDIDRLQFGPLHAFDAAAETLAQLAPSEFGLVACSARTRAELEHLHDRLRLRQPFICEHGGAVLIPDGYFDFHIPNARAVTAYEAVEYGRPYAEVAATLQRTATRLGIPIIAFSELSIGDVARELRVPLLEARLAKLREYGELFRVVGGEAERQKLFKALHTARLECTAGSPFDHVGAPVDYSVGMHLVTELYRRAHGDVRAAIVDSAGLDVERWAAAVVDAVRAARRRRMTPVTEST